MDIHIDKNSLIPVYRQIVNAIESMIETRVLKEGDILPSMNELAEMLEISKETSKKAYIVLRDDGKIESKQGKGFYVRADGGAKKLKVLAIFDKLSTYKQILFNSMLEALDNNAEITICLHEQNVDMLEYFLNENLDNFDYYVDTEEGLLSSEENSQPQVAHARQLDETDSWKLRSGLSGLGERHSQGAFRRSGHIEKL